MKFDGNKCLKKNISKNQKSSFPWIRLKLIVAFDFTRRSIWMLPGKPFLNLGIVVDENVSQFGDFILFVIFADGRKTMDQFEI